MSKRGSVKGVGRAAARVSAGEGDASATVDHVLCTATPERLKKSTYRIETRTSGDGKQPCLGIRVLDACPLDAYLRRGALDRRQHEAGTWLARCFRRAVHQPSMVTHYGERLGGGGGSDPMMDGRKALWRVLLATGLAMTGDGQKFGKMPACLEGGAVGGRSSVILTPPGQVALSVCGLEEWAGGTRNLGKLRTALDRLADHLRIHGCPSQRPPASVTIGSAVGGQRAGLPQF